MDWRRCHNGRPLLVLKKYIPRLVSLDWACLAPPLSSSLDDNCVNVPAAHLAKLKSNHPLFLNKYWAPLKLPSYSVDNVKAATRFFFCLTKQNNLHLFFRFRLLSPIFTIDYVSFCPLLVFVFISGTGTNCPLVVEMPYYTSNLKLTFTTKHI